MVSSTADAVATLTRSLATATDTDSVVVLGKGPSTEHVDPEVFHRSLIIAINDAERIHPADVTVFYEPWVAESVRDSGLQSEVYLTPEKFDAGQKTVIEVPYAPLHNGEEDLMLSRFQDRESFAIEGALFLTALELARGVADARQSPLDVYMVGFDFTPETGPARAATTAFAPDSAIRRASIETQQYILQNALYALEDSLLTVHHVGTKNFSALTVEDLNRLMGHPRAASVTPGTVQQADLQDSPAVEITAEITTNHFGDLNRLEELVRAAHAAGADWVKVQKRDVETFYTPQQLAAPYKSPFGTTFGDYRRQLELTHEGFELLDELTTSLGIKWFASVLDKPSFEWMTTEVSPALLKLPSTISEKKDYLAHVADTYAGSLVISTGMTDKSYEDWLLQTFTRQKNIYLLHCNSAYPTPAEHTNIGVVRRYAELAERQRSTGTGPTIIPGYSSHDHGWLASALAVAAGARMVEKHVKLGNTEWAHFDAVAVDLETDDFTEYVAAVRQAQVHVGSEEKRITASEHHKY